VYNHSENNNCYVEYIGDKLVMKSNRNIYKGEQLFINYGKHWCNNKKVKKI